MSNSRTQHRVLFAAYNGPGPWPCHFCGEDVDLERMKVHHDDGVHENNTPTNLVPAHHSCHARHHGRTSTHLRLPVPPRVQAMGVVASHTPEANAKRRASLVKTYATRTPEQEAARGAAISEGKKRSGYRHSEATRQKMRSAALRRRRAT